MLIFLVVSSTMPNDHQNLAGFWGDLPENWRPVVGFEGYYVSDLGRVASTKRAKSRVLRTKILRDGYVQVTLMGRTRSNTRLVHRLVAEAFIGTLRRGMVVNHMNMVRDDNRAANLEIVPHGENIRHAFETIAASGRDPFAAIRKITKDQIRDMIGLYNAGGVTQRELSEKYGITQAHVSRLITDSRRGLVVGDYTTSWT